MAAAAVSLEEVRRWSGSAAAGLPSLEVANGLLLELLESQLHPAVAQQLLAKASPAQLVLRGNILGPRHHAAELLRARASGLRRPASELGPEHDDAAACCASPMKAAAEEVQAYSAGGASKSDAFPEPDKLNTAAALRTAGTGWVLAPLAICSWGAVLAAVVLLKWA